MQDPFNKPNFPTMRRAEQASLSHCGPAVLEMLLSFVGKETTQEQITQASGLAGKIKGYGMLVSDMARGAKNLFPDVNFWYKNNSSLSDLAVIINNHQYPVGVEWQGVFYEDADDDNGHYSVVTMIDTTNNIIMLADPYRRFAGHDRIFHVLEFQDRWWDENEVKDPLTGRTTIEEDDKMMFVITPKDVVFPESLGMIQS